MTRWKKTDKDLATILPNDVQAVVKGENCFDFLRYLFAFSLIIAHFSTLMGIDQVWFISGGMRVKAFFVITGFLVSYSFIRRKADVKSYFLKRFVRIVPAYICAICLCFILGLWLTDMPRSAFLASSQTWKYMACNLLMLNWLQPELPGVFQANPLPQMDAALWSMKLEVIFYVLVPVLIALVYRYGKRWVLPLIFVIVTASYPFIPIQCQYFTFFLSGMTVLLCFQYHKWLKLMLVLCAALMAVPYLINCEPINSCVAILEPYLFAVVLVGVAYLFSFLNFFRRFDNITYGLYLFHFPVAQTLIHFHVNERSILLTFILTLAITICLATLSWKFIEQPLMNKYK